MSGVDRWSSLPALLFLILTLSSFTADDGQFSYYGFTSSNPTLDGTAEILPGGLLQLVNGTNIKDHAFHLIQLHFRKNDTVQSFSASLVFGIIPAFYDSSEGITFFIAPAKNLSGTLPAQYLGLFNSQNNGNSSNHVFAVELDTVQNTEFQDIDGNHVGINVNSLHSIQSYPAGYYDDGWNGNFNNLSLSSAKAMQVWLDYGGEAASINVTLVPFKTAKPIRPLVRTFYDLSLVLTEPAYVGLSSATGSISSRHYILGWSFSMNGPAPAFFTAQLPDLPRVLKAARNKVIQVIVPIASATSVFVVGLAVFLFALPLTY